jgi:sphingolipid 8-(E)-desaturase
VFANSLWSSYYKRVFEFDAAAKFFISLQHKLFYVVMSLARFNLYRLSYIFLLTRGAKPMTSKNGRWTWALEMTGIAFFWCWFAAVLRGTGSWQTALAYLLVSHIVPSPLHVQVGVTSAIP